MSIRLIVKDPDPVLREVAKEVTKFNANLQKLLKDMAETMYDADGVGLAAPQIGISKRVIVVDVGDDNGLIEMVNPVIVDSSSELDVAWEGCLSFMQYRVRVERPRSIAVEYLTLGGRPARLDASGFFARVLQHEIDHLNGILTLDRAVGPEDVARVDEETTPATDESKGRAEHS